MVPVSYHDFFGGCATVAGALIGLLFVAISVSPEKLAGERASVDHQVRAGAAFSALVNALVIALVALLPTANLGVAAIAVAAAGLGSTAGLIILLYREHKERIRLSQITMLVALFVLYGLQLANGIQLNDSPPQPGRCQQPGRALHHLLPVRHRACLAARRCTGHGPPVGCRRDRPAARHQGRASHRK